MDLLLRARRALAVLTFCAFAVLQSAAAHALPIAITELQRSTSGDASATLAGDTDTGSDHDETQATGSVVLDSTGDASLPDWGAHARGTGFQESEVSEALLSGHGTAHTFTQTSYWPSYLLASSESLFRIVLTPTADLQLQLTGRLSSWTHGSSTASALLELSSIDTTIDPLVILFRSDGGHRDQVDIDVPVLLRAGVSYRLLALVRSGSDMRGDELASSGAAFNFHLGEVVPEPATAFSLALGLALLAKLRPPLPA